MAIRINLLAEAQAAEDLRRRDPVKRALMVGLFLAMLMVGWSGWLQISTMRANTAQHRSEQLWQRIEKDYQGVTNSIQRVAAIEARLNALYRVSTNRFLWAPAVSAVQEVMTDDRIQITKFRGDNSFKIETPPRKAGAKVAPPPIAKEQITVTIEARDFGTRAEANFDRFKERLSNHDYFKGMAQQRDRFALFGVLGNPVVDPADSSRVHVPFALQSRFPEITREQ